MPTLSSVDLPAKQIPLVISHLANDIVGGVIAGVQFTFTIDAESWTAAGVYDANGKLVQTVWKRRRYAKGTYVENWDGKDDKGVQQPAGTYTVRLIQHDIKAWWDGVIGNTTGPSGNSIRTFWPMMTSGSFSITPSGRMYFVDGTNEVSETIWRMETSDLDTVTPIARAQGVGWTLAATDGTIAYLANTGSDDDANNNTFVGGYKVSDDTKATFSGGSTATITNPHADIFSAIDLHVGSNQSDRNNNAATGLAVQLDTQGAGNVLAVSHGPLNVIRLFNKTTGAVLATPTIATAFIPGALAFDASGALWVCESAGTRAFRYINVDTAPFLQKTVTGLGNPLNVACHPSNVDLVYIIDGDAHQQIKTYNSGGTLLNSQGQNGGYDAHGPAVGTNIYQWRGSRAPLAVDASGAIYVGDGDTNRILVYNASWVFQKQTMWLPQSGICWLDENAPTRVGANFLEYQVDYTKALTNTGSNGSWSLVKNWAAGTSPMYNGFFNTAKFTSGFGAVYTLSNSRVYGIILNNIQGFDYNDLVELTSIGIRPTGVVVHTYHEWFNPDGSITKITTDGTTETIQRKTISSFDGDGNPVYGAYSTLASWPDTPGESAIPFTVQPPIARVMPNGNYAIYNYATANNGGANYEEGTHLGIFQVAGTDFLIKSSPAVAAHWPFDDNGDYQKGSLYNALNFNSAGRICIGGQKGEFWKQSEADQYMGFDQNGLPLIQFGTTGDTVIPTGSSVPGMGGNAQSPQAILSGVEGYHYSVDEANTGGVKRFHFSGLPSILDHSASGALGAAITLTKTAVHFPTGLAAVPSNGQVVLSWTAVSGASAINVWRSTTPGGPYTKLTSVALAGNATTYTDSTPTNGTVYYYQVVSTVSGVDYGSSEVSSMPFDTTVVMQSAGHLSWAKSLYAILPVYTVQPWPLLLETSANILGTLRLNQLGSFGYYIWEHVNRGGDTSHLPVGASIARDSHWTVLENSHAVGIAFAIDDTTHNTTGIWSTLGSQGGYYAGTNFGVSSGTPSSDDASITVDPGDSNWHYISVIADGTKYTIKAVPFGLSTPSASQSIDETIHPHTLGGFSHIHQFLCKGKTTITIPAGAVSFALKAVFVDNAPEMA